MYRILATGALLLACGACGSLPSVTDDPDFALCELARAQALRGDPASEQTLDRIKDLRSAWYCKNDLMIRDRGVPPNGT